MGMVRVKKLALAASVSLLMAPSAQAGLLSKWDELTVKGGELESCPGVTLEQQADSFFKDPEWSAGKAADGRKLVNVSGTFTYMERPVRGMLQMWVQGEGFSVEALEINGQPQPEIMIDALLDKMCEAAKEEAAPNSSTWETAPPLHRQAQLQLCWWKGDRAIHHDPTERQDGDRKLWGIPDGRQWQLPRPQLFCGLDRYVCHATQDKLSYVSYRKGSDLPDRTRWQPSKRLLGIKRGLQRQSV